MTHNHGFDPNEIRKIADADSFQHPTEGPLRAGDVVNLNSGSPPMMVVEYVGTDRLIVAWRDESGAVFEADFHRACLHRVPLV
jgi:uncharacterized protein YodC (DUF2158 family)